MKPKHFFVLTLLLQLFITSCHTNEKNGVTQQSSQQEIQPPHQISAQNFRVGKPEFVHGIHLSAWVAGSINLRNRFEQLLSRDKLNTIVIAIKEYQGELYIPNVELTKKYNIPVRPIPNLEKYLFHLKSKGVYPIARIVVFKDNFLARNNPHLAVKNPDGSVWKDYKGNSWADPYNKEVWKYNIEIAKKAVELGFEEIQFDYIRFPSDGNTKLCRYSEIHNSTTATNALINFLSYAKEELAKYAVPISIDVFGLTPSVGHDMGIGQRFVKLVSVCDYISPMMYPSHYAKGEYGLSDPNKFPYKTIYRGVSDAKKLLKEESYKLRPYLQDFSLGYKYGYDEVKAQIVACYDNGIFDWLLWDPKCKYNLQVIEEMAKYTPKNYVPTTSTKKSSTTINTEN
jgi:hypothetical protein